ncbi:MAG: STM4013/SEN3800 family hydrolase [Peptostreptococcaceae bacterium]|nr:STM4013/SEN3800 family hydrolase [Peptostreptococcaceae bacterium]
MTKVKEVPKFVIGDPKKAKMTVNMNEVVGNCDILFVCLDTLRYDVAKQEEEQGNTPNMSRYGPWLKCHAPGNYTFPSHMAMFIGNLPSLAEPIPLYERERLFVAKENQGLGKLHPYSFVFEGNSFVQGLEKVGYETICVGGVGFFNKRTPINRILPDLFMRSYWNTRFACHIKKSFENQLDFVQKILSKMPKEQKIFMYINVNSIHYPNSFYLEDAKEDDVHTHAAALRYVDRHIVRLFDLFSKRGSTFCILCSDHGSCYGEDGYRFHCHSHEIVWTVPYKHFFIGEDREMDRSQRDPVDQGGKDERK